MRGGGSVVRGGWVRWGHRVCVPAGGAVVPGVVQVIVRRQTMVVMGDMVTRGTMRMMELRGAQRGGGVGGREEAAVAELTLVGGADVEWSHHQGLLGVGESCIGQ